jgi:WD40 repeat protein
MKTGTSISALLAFSIIAAIVGCGGGGGDDFSQPLKPLGGGATDAKVSGESPAAPPSEPKAAEAASAVTAAAADTTAAANPAAQAATPSAGGGGLGLFGAAATAPDPAAPTELVEGIAATATDDGLAADLSSDGRLLVAERGDGRFGVYEVNRRINLMSLKAAENNITKLTFDGKKGLISAVLPSGKIQVWRYQSTIGLDKYAKEAIAADAFLRGFEGHPGGTFGVAVSPIRDEMVSVGADGQLRFWRTNESTSTRPFEQSGNDIQHLVISIDGSQAAALTARGIVTLWDTSSGKSRTMPVGDRVVTCLAVDTKGSLLAAGDSAGSVVLLETESGKTSELSLGRQPVADIRFEEESQRLFAIATDGESRAWNLPLSSPTIIEGLTAAGGLIAVSTDLNRVVAVNRQGRLRLHALAGDAPAQEVSTGLERITALEYFGGDSVIVGNDSGQIEIQEASGLRKLLVTGETAVTQLRGSSEGMVATLDSQGNAGIWNAGESKVIARFADETVLASANDAAFPALAIAFKSGKQVVVDLSNGETTATRQSNDKDISSVALNSRRGMVAFGHSSGNVSLWLFREKSELIPLGQHAAAVTQVRIAESGEFVYTGAGDGTVCNWPTQFKQTAPTLEKLPAEIRLAEFASQQAMGVAATDNAVFTIDLLTGKAKELSGLPRPVRLRISADGSLFALLTGEGLVNLYETDSGTLFRQHPATEQIVDIAFQTVERTYLSLDTQGNMKRWSRPASGLTSAGDSLKGASGIWLSPSGAILAIATESKQIRFLSVAENYKVLSTVTVESGVQLLAWINDQSCAVTSPGMKSVFLVELQGGRARKALVDLPGPATQFCRRADNGDLLAICGTRLVKVRPASGDIRVHDISFKASDRDTIVNCGKTTMLLSGGRIFRVGRDDKVEIDERVANVTSLSGSVSERAAVVITESGNMLAFSDNKFTDAGVNPLPNSRVTISDDGQSLWIQPTSGEGIIWSVRDRKGLQQFSFPGTPVLRSWLPDQTALVQIDTAGAVSVLRSYVTSEWTTGVTNAQSLSVSPGGNLALVRDSGANAVLHDLASRQSRTINVEDALFAEIADDTGTVVSVSSTGQVDRISQAGVQSQKVDGAVRSVSMDRSRRTLAILYGSDKSGLVQIENFSGVDSLPGGEEQRRTFTTPMGYLLTNSRGDLRFGVLLAMQSSGTPKAGHKGGCSGIAVLQNQIITAGRDGVVRSWSPDLSAHTDIFRHSRGIDSLNVPSPAQQITACDELGEILTLSPDGKISSGATRTGLGPGARIFGQDSDGNLVIAAHRQLVRFKSDGTPRDGVQFKEDCVHFGVAGREGRRFALEKNGNLYAFNFVRQRHLIQSNAKISGLHWTSASQMAVISGKQVEIISADGDVVASAVADTEIVASGISPDGQYLATLSVAGELGLFETKSLNKKSSFRPGIAANRIAVGLTGETVLLYGIDSAEEWSINGTRLRRLSVTGVNNAFYVEGATFLITSMKNGELRTWPRQQMFSSRPASAAKNGRLLPQGTGAIFVDEKGMVTAESADGTVHWKSTDPTPDIRKSSFSTNGGRVLLLTGANGKRHASVYDQKTGLIKQIEIPPACTDIHLSPDGSSLLQILEKSVEIRSVETGLVTQVVNVQAKECLFVTANSLLFVDSLGGLRIAGTGELGTIQITEGQGTAVAFDETGNRVATGTSDGMVTVWDRESSELKKVYEFTTQSPVRQIIFRGSLLIVRTDLPTVSIWVISPGESASSQTLSFTHRGVPTLFQLDEKQELLATVNSANEVSVWDLTNRNSAGRMILSITGNDQRVAALAFSNASENLVSLDASGTVSVNPLPNLARLRENQTAEVMERQSSGLLEELTLSLSGSERSGNDLTSRKFRQEEAVRRDLQTLRSGSAEGSPAPVSDSRLNENIVERMMSARSTQYEGAYEQQFSEGDGARQPFPSGKDRKWTPPSGLIAEFQTVKSLPGAIAAAAATESENPEPVRGSVSQDNSVNGLVRKLVVSQRSFVRQLSGSALSGLLEAGTESSLDPKSIESFRRQLEQMSDSRAIQTIVTNFRFPQEGAEAIRVALQISSDGGTVAAAFPPLGEEESKGSLNVWDMLSGIPLKQFETTEDTREMYLSTVEDQLLTMPSVSVYRLFDNLPPRYLTRGSSIAWRRTQEKPLLAVARQVRADSQEQLLALYDAKSFDNVPFSMPEGFNTIARAVSFGHRNEKMAIAISERGQDHKLFVCRTDELSRFEVLTPVDSIDGNFFKESQGGVGFPALAFSPDDQTLLAVAHAQDGTEGFSVRMYGLKNEQWSMTTSMPLPKEGFASVADPITLSFVGQLPRVSIWTPVGIFVGDLNAGKKKRNDSVWGIPLNKDITRTVEFSDDGRWLAIGKSNGTIAIHDLSSANPSLSIPVQAEGDSAHDGPVIGLSFSRPLQGTKNPTYLASFGRENRIKVWPLIDIEEQLARARKTR